MRPDQVPVPDEVLAEVLELAEELLHSMSWKVAWMAERIGFGSGTAAGIQLQVAEDRPDAVLNETGAMVSTRSCIRMVPLMSVALNCSKTSSAMRAWRSMSDRCGKGKAVVGPCRCALSSLRRSAARSSRSDLRLRLDQQTLVIEQQVGHQVRGGCRSVRWPGPGTRAVRPLHRGVVAVQREVGVQLGDPVAHAFQLQGGIAQRGGAIDPQGPQVARPEVGHVAQLAVHA